MLIGKPIGSDHIPNEKRRSLLIFETLGISMLCRRRAIEFVAEESNGPANKSASNGGSTLCTAIEAAVASAVTSG